MNDLDENGIAGSEYGINMTEIIFLFFGILNSTL